MEGELLEIKEKILNFCDKYNIKEIKIETTNIIRELEKSKVNDISLNIEV